MDEERQVQSSVDEPSAVRSLLFARREIDSPFRGWFCLQAPRKGDDFGAQAVWLLRSLSETGRKGKTARSFDAKWILEEVFMRRGDCVCSRAVRLIFPIPSSPPDTMRRLLFDSNANRPIPRYPFEPLCAYQAVTKQSLPFPPFRIQYLTSKRTSCSNCHKHCTFFHPLMKLLANHSQKSDKDNNLKKIIDS